MTLVITDDVVEACLEMGPCIDAVDRAFRAYAVGGAVNRPRSHTYTDLGDGHHYLFKSMDGAVAELGVHAIRLSSDRTHELVRDGRHVRDKIAAAPGGRYVGLVLLFDIATLVPLAIMADGYLQRMRVGATSALAARHLACDDVRTAGMIGTGWQAGAQLLGLHERGTITGYRVYSPDPERRRTFCAQWSEHLGCEVLAVDSAREAVEGLGIVALATNAHEPVLDGAWLAPGQHVGSVQGHELDWATLERADVIGVRSREEATFHHAPGHAPQEVAGRKQLPEHLRARTVELSAVVTGEAGRSDPAQVTLFTGGGTGASSGLGIQFTAVAHAVHAAVTAAGRGHEIPTEWLTQRHKP